MASVTPITAGQHYTESRLAVLNEQIYAYKHGIRPLVLQTMAAEDKADIEKRLQRDNLTYHIEKTPKGNSLNVFFGDKPCVDVVKSFGKTPLYKLSPEKDFILGIMLGYDKTKQCERYLKMKDKEAAQQNKLDVVA